MGIETSSPLPSQFGKYSLLGHLATGGMAEVYIARQAGLQGFEKIVVIKRVRPELNADIETTSFFLDEARLVATLEHPNIAQVYEIGIVNDSYFFVMEYVHGADLRQLMERALEKRRGVSLADAIYIIIGVANALHYAHEKHDRDGHPLDIIHRDVTPSNVLLSHDGAVKVCDFGIAKASNRMTETSSGTLKGKYAYMSPEQCRSKPLDRRSDIFTIGILLYELTTLSNLFKADSEFELLRKIIESPIPLPSSRIADYPPELERIVMRALAKNPDERYQTAQELQLDLEEFARERKLALSSVNIAKLMGSLFERRVQSWASAQQAGQDLVDHLMDTSVRQSGKLPVFLPAGSDDHEITIEADPREITPSRRSRPIPVQSPPITETRRGPPIWPLALAVVAGLAAGGVTVAGSMIEKAANSESAARLQSDAERVTSTIDAAARTAHMKADGIAMTPMLRAAIETDAATMHDLAQNEYVFSPGAGETIEIFQTKHGATASMLRLPTTAPPIPPISGRDTHLSQSASGLLLVAASPLTGNGKSGVVGTVAIAIPVDLSQVKRTLGDHAISASLVGLGADLPLVPPHAGEGGEPTRIELPPSDGISGSLALVAVPVTAATPTWIVPSRYAAIGLAALFLLLFGYLRARSRAT